MTRQHFSRRDVVGICAIYLLLAFALVEAQSTLKVMRDQNAAADGVVSYNLYVDGVAPISVANALNGTCNCILAPVTFVSGTHTIKVTALAPLLSTDPTSLIEGPPASMTFTLNPGSQIRNVKVTK